MHYGRTTNVEIEPLDLLEAGINTTDIGVAPPLPPPRIEEREDPFHEAQKLDDQPMKSDSYYKLHRFKERLFHRRESEPVLVPDNEYASLHEKVEIPEGHTFKSGTSRTSVSQETPENLHKKYKTYRC